MYDSSMVGGSMGMPSGPFNPMVQMAAAFMQQMQRKPGQQDEVDITMQPQRRRAPSPPLALTGDPLLALTENPIMALDNQAADDTVTRPGPSVRSHAEVVSAPRHDASGIQLPRKRNRPEPLSGGVSVDDLIIELTKSKKATAARASDDDLPSEPEDAAPRQSSQRAARPRQSSHVDGGSGDAAIMKRPAAAKPPAGHAKAKVACADPAETLDDVKRRLGFIKGGPKKGPPTPDLKNGGAISWNGCRIYIKPDHKTMRVVPLTLRYDKKFTWPSKSDGKNASEVWATVVKYCRDPSYPCHFEERPINRK